MMIFCSNFTVVKKMMMWFGRDLLFI